MSGRIKVSGTWKTTGNVYVKVSGTWHTVFQAYTKVGGTWKLWHTPTITDTFTRANTSSGLGTSENGPAWTSLFGNWFVNGGAATSGDAVSARTAGAISYLNLNNANATVAVGGQSTTAGVGPAVWVSAAGSWWAAIGYNGQTNTTYTYNCNCTCNGHTVATCNTCANAAFGTSTGTGFYNASSYTATATATYGYVSSGGSVIVSSYTTSSSSSYAATISYSCPSGGTAGAGGHTQSSCYTTGYTYSCPSGQYLGNGSSYAPSTTSCYYNRNDQYVGPATATPYYTYTGTSVQTFSCGSGYTNCAGSPAACCAQTPNYGCSDGSTYVNGGCYNYVQTDTTYSCPSGGSLFGSACVSCPSGGSFYQGVNGYGCYYSYSYYNTGTSCTYCGTTYTFYSGGTANPSTGAGCDSYGFTCQTCSGGAITTNYYMQVINSTTTGSAYTVYSTSSDYGAQIGSISLTTSGNNLTATAYGTTGSSLGTLSATNTGTKGGGVGLVKAYTPYNQGTTGDNFSATLGATS